MGLQSNTLPSEPQSPLGTPARRWRKGADTETLWRLYQELGSTHKVGEAVSMSFSAVHRRLTNAGYKLLGPKGETRECARCKKSFQATNYKDLYCGDDCRREAFNGQQNRLHRKKHPLSVKQCENPGCPLPDRKFMQQNDTREKYCSDACIAAANRLRNAELFRKHARLRSSKVREYERLINVVDLKLIDGLRVSIAAHLQLKAMKESDMKFLVYPEEMADRYDSTKKLIIRNDEPLSRERARIGKLSTEGREEELQRLHKRLRHALKLPPDKA